jgi:hypothetical protein
MKIMENGELRIELSVSVSSIGNDASYKLD